MKLDDLNARAKSNVKNRGECCRSGYPVMLTKLNNSGHNRLAITIYREPRNCNFKSTAYWLPIWIAESNRLYIVYSNGTDGYKRTPGKTNIGRIQFSPDSDLKERLNSVISGTRKTFNWQWDDECSRAYILIEE